MLVYIGCSCGESLGIETERAGTHVECPRCGRRHAVPRPVGAEPAAGRRRGRVLWLPVTGSALALIVMLAGLAWALMASGGGSGGDGDGNPWAGRFDRGMGSGTGGRGNPGGDSPGGQGAGGDGGGSPSAAVEASPQPAQAPAPPAPTPPQADEAPKAGKRPTSMKAVIDDAIAELPPPPRPQPEPEVPVGGGEGPGEAVGRNGTGGGGPFGQRGDSDLALRMGASRESETAVDLGLAWLKSVQRADGSWTDGSHDVGVTGLATLAFLGAGHTHRGKSGYAATVGKALQWLRDRQDALGKVSPRMYQHGLASIALSEAYGMTEDLPLKRPAQKAIDFLVRQMGANGGYGYTGPGDDTHVTSYQVMAIKSARLAKLDVPSPVVPKLRKYYDAAMGPDGTTGYRSASGRGAPQGARTAVGLFCRFLLDAGRKDASVLKIAEVLDKAGPQVGNVYQTYYGTYGMFQMGGAYWKGWNARFRDKVVAMQDKTPGRNRGSWGGGNVVNTTIYIMAMEVYYRYLPVNK